jgi:hypothetical protein
MNVFVLNTGRCGSLSFTKACRHIANYSVGHESRSHLLGPARLDYPDNHIEVDNRLSWFLGRLDARYGNDAIYVHLKRNDTATAMSFVRRYSEGIIDAYRRSVLMALSEDSLPRSVCLDYCHTVNKNIELFLKGKSRTITVELESIKNDFPRFWRLISAEGDLEAALREFELTYNASPAPRVRTHANRTLLRLTRKIARVIAGFPSFLRQA